VAFLQLRLYLMSKVSGVRRKLHRLHLPLLWSNESVVGLAKCGQLSKKIANPQYPIPTSSVDVAALVMTVSRWEATAKK
jgi:hypothetical protein